MRLLKHFFKLLFCLPIPFCDNTTDYPNDSINPLSIVTDPESDSFTVEIVWWNGSFEHFRNNKTYASGSNASYTLTENLTNIFRKGENWTAAFNVNDATGSSGWTNTSRYINNSHPVNANTTITIASPIKTDNLNC